MDAQNESHAALPRGPFSAGFDLAAELERVVMVGLAPSIASHLMAPIRAVAPDVSVKAVRRSDLGAPRSLPAGTLLVLQDRQEQETGLATLRDLRRLGVRTPAILVVVGEDFICPRDLDSLGDLDVIPLSEFTRFSFRRSLIVLGGQTARDKLLREVAARQRAYEGLLAAKDEERLRALGVATRLEKRLARLETEMQQTESSWAERLKRSDTQNACLEERIVELESGNGTSKSAAVEAMQRRLAARELTIHREERAILEGRIAELSQVVAEHEQEARQRQAEHSQREELTTRLEASERVRAAQTQQLLIAQRRIDHLEQHLDALAALLETDRESPGDLLEKVAQRLTEAGGPRPAEVEGTLDQLSHHLAMREVDATFDDERSRRNVLRRVEAAVLRSRRLGLPLTALMLGVDRAGALRDEHGSVAYDFIQVQVAQRLQLALRQGDLVMRTEDGSFLLLTEARSTEAARSHATRLRAVCREPFQLGDDRVAVRLSVAIVSCDDEIEGASDLIRRARLGLLEAQAREEPVLVLAASQSPAPSVPAPTMAGKDASKRL